MPAPIASIRPASRPASRSRRRSRRSRRSRSIFSTAARSASPSRTSPDMGVRRISVGGTLARVAMHAFIKSARADRRRRQVRQLRRRHAECRAQQVFPRRPAAPPQAVSEHRHPQTGQPIGAPVDDTPAQRPGPVTLTGPLRPRRKAQCRTRGIVVATSSKATTRSGPICRNTGPFAERGRIFRLGATSASRSQDPYSYAIVDRRPRARHRDADGNSARHAGHRGRPHRLFAGAATQRRSAPRRNICWRATPSKRSATGATSGSATRTMPPRGARRCATASPSKASCASR